MSAARCDAFVFFGATGDLAFKQIFPALQALVRHGRLAVPIIGVGLSGWTLDKFRAHARESLQTHGGVDEAAFGELVKLLRYIDGDYNLDATFAELKGALGSAQHPLHYLAIPPDMFTVVIKQLGRSGCAKGARVIVEKPFGRDLASAQALNATLQEVFAEPAIFRIDHYLGKEAVQNLSVLRFSNTFLEPIWNRNYIRSVQITMAEAFGVAGRGKFYEEVGAIRDVVQNHMLQVVGLLAMEPPASTYNEAIRDERVKVFRQIVPLRAEDVVRGQFAGYTAEPGVAKDSTVETFAALRLQVSSWRWNGVPFLIRVGKCLPVTATEVVVELKPPPVSRLGEEGSNYLRLRLSPEVLISLGLRIKQAGETLASEATELSVVRRPEAGEMAPYERLLGDAMDGDATLFAREDAVEAAWRIVEPVLGAGSPIHSYARGSWGPAQAERLAADGGGWAEPK